MSDMPKHLHEIRDPIHVFIRLDTDERRVVDSLPVQRLRHIHQLATTFLVYPGATLKRFEHSLGVMELAGRVFDVVTHPYNIHDDIRQLVPQITDPRQLREWLRANRQTIITPTEGPDDE
jgi:HD superfamily phosphohydrolase